MEQEQHFSETLQRYEAERKARIQNGRGLGQYEAYVPPARPVQPGRNAISEEMDLLIIGGGISGLVAAVRLGKLFHKVRIVEKAADFGGTWFHNRYPGVQCDIESYIYLPLLEETGYIPSEKYASGSEIQAYLASVGRKFNLYDKTYFNTRVTQLTWSETERRWVVATELGDLFKPRYVVASFSPLRRPKIPRMSGIESFKGQVFHANCWPYDYTGGSANQRNPPLELLKDKRVGIIGTGATAVQCTPHLALYARHLVVFQRTPTVILPRGNKATDVADFASQPPGWQRQRMENFDNVLLGRSPDKDLVDDSWTNAFKALASPASKDIEKKNFELMEAARARISTTVTDTNVANLLKPYYRFLCKRPCFSDDYLAVFNRKNVTLVDTGVSGVATAVEDGVLVSGVHYQLDCLCFATGFQIGTNLCSNLGFDAIGVSNTSLSQKFERERSTLHGFYTNGFPNMFFLGILQTGFSVNWTRMIEEQCNHLSVLFTAANLRNATRIEVTAEGEHDWVSHITTRWTGSGDRAFWKDRCPPSFYNSEGDADISIVSNNYVGGPLRFFDLLAAWREEGTFKGLSIS